MASFYLEQSLIILLVLESCRRHGCRADRRRRGGLRRWLHGLLREAEGQARLGTADREVDA